MPKSNQGIVEFHQTIQVVVCYYFSSHFPLHLVFKGCNRLILMSGHNNHLWFHFNVQHNQLICCSNINHSKLIKVSKIICLQTNSLCIQIIKIFSDKLTAVQTFLNFCKWFLKEGGKTLYRNANIFLKSLI